MLPDPFVGIQLGSVAGQLFESEPFGSTLGQENLFTALLRWMGEPSRITKSLPAIWHGSSRCPRNLTTPAPSMLYLLLHHFVELALVKA